MARSSLLKWGVVGGIVVVLVVLNLWRSVSTGSSYPTPLSMPPVVAESMPAAIARLEAALKEHAPAVLESLQPGLTIEQIEQLETANSIKLTDELRALYQWRNGVPEGVYTNLTPLHRFASLEENLSGRRASQQQLAEASAVERIAHNTLVGYKMAWIPIFEDIAGDGYFYDPTRSVAEGAYFDSFLETGSYEFYPSLRNLLIALAECYESKAYFVEDAGQLNADFAAAQAIHAKYSSSVD
jgi:cell wall assembly regulator SMI1